MPLGNNVSENIKELSHAKRKRSRKQIIAIAYSAARKSKRSTSNGYIKNA